MNDDELDRDRPMDRLERLANLHLDLRLSDPERAEFERELARSPELAALVRALAAQRAELLGAAAPPVPAGLSLRIRARVARERRQAAALPLARGLAIAAGLLLAATLFLRDGGGARVFAGDTAAEPTVEDQIRARQRPDGSLVDYLAWRLIGREEGGR